MTHKGNSPQYGVLYLMCREGNVLDNPYKVWQYVQDDELNHLVTCPRCKEAMEVEWMSQEGTVTIV